MPNGTDGTITFRLYGPFTTAPTAQTAATDCVPANLVTAYGTNGATTKTVTSHNVTGLGNTTNPYTSTAFTPTQPGIYQWTAEFTPTPGQGLDPSGEIGCGQAVEQSVVSKAQSTIRTEQSWVPSDKAILGQTAGTVTFTLLKNVSQANCVSGNYLPADAVYTSNAVSVTDTTAPIEVSIADATTQPNPVTASDVAGDQYRWKVVYSGTSAFNAATTCNEFTNILLDNGAQVTQ